MPLAPDDACQLLDEMLLGWPLRQVLGHQRVKQLRIFLGIFPGQHSVFRQHPMPEPIEAGDVVIAAPGWGSICTFSARLIARTPSSRAAPASAITILQPLQGE